VRTDVTVDTIHGLLAEGLDKHAIAEQPGVSLDLVYRRLRDGDPRHPVPRLAAEQPKGGIPEWVTTAPCGDTPDLFFPRRAADNGPAVEVCRACTHRLPCLEWALQQDIQDGIWGGLTDRERRKLKRSA